MDSWTYKLMVLLIFILAIVLVILYFPYKVMTCAIQNFLRCPRRRNAQQNEDKSDNVDVELAEWRPEERCNQAEVFRNARNVDSFRNCRETYEKTVAISDLEEKPSHNLSKRCESKNRYRNVHPYDFNRVVLKTLSGREESCYINASYIKINKCPYIATQGPTASTICDFWRMIEEQGVTCIVMLTPCKELDMHSGAYGMKDKCTKYYPSSDETLVIDKNTTITNTKEEYKDANIVRTLVMKHLKKCRTVTQFHCVSWSDHSIPQTTTGIYHIQKKIQGMEHKDPIVVHCSAGVGRTGTYIAYDVMVRNQNLTSLSDLLRNLRKQRPMMIQTVEQYALVVSLISEYHKFKGTDIQLKDLSARIADMEEHPTQWQNEFEMTSPNAQLYRSVYGWKENIPTILAAVDLSLRYEGCAIDIYGMVGKKVIVLKDPRERDVESFWQTVEANSVRLMVAVESTDNSDTVMDKLCPFHGGEKNSLSVLSKDEDLRAHHAARTIVIQHTNNNSSTTLKQLRFNKMDPQQYPTILYNFITMMNDMVEKMKEGETILIHSSQGTNGVFIVLWNLHRRYQVEKSFDVIRTVKDLLELKEFAISQDDLVSIYKYLAATFHDESDDV